MSRGFKKAALALIVLVSLLGLVLWLVWRGERSAQQGEAEDQRAADDLSDGRNGAPSIDGEMVRFGGSPTASARATRDRAAGAGTLEGRVLSWATGEPITDAELTFARETSISSTFTDMGGGFAFRASAQGEYELLSVTAEGYLPFAPELGHSPVTLEARPGYRIRDIIIHLRPAEELVGRVTDPEGQPVGGAEVVVISAPEGPPSLAAFPESFTSGENGEFQIQAPLGALLEARHPDFSPGRARLDRASSLSGRLEIQLGQGAETAGNEEISGRVVDESGRPVAGALVVSQFALRTRFGLNASGQSLTDEDGHFLLEGLDRGRYHLQATAEGMTPGRLLGVETGTDDVSIALRRGASIRGVVTDAASGEPIPSFSVVIQIRLSPLRLVPYRTVSVFDAEGRFEVTGMETNRYTINVTTPGYSPSDLQDLAINQLLGESRVDFTLARGGRAQGVVRDAETGEPIADARVAIEAREDPTGPPVPLVAQAVTDFGGRFEIRGLTPGRRSLIVSARGYHQTILSALEVTEDGSLGPLEISLTAAGEGVEPELELIGIGAVLAPRVVDLMIVRVLDGGGASEVGLVPGDIILRVDGRSIADIGFNGAIEQIRGQEGTAVRLSVRRRGSTEETDLTVTRRRVRG